jgi:hypothetical protein
LLAVLTPIIGLVSLLSFPAHAATASGSSWKDVPRGYWARGAIDAVAYHNAWMRDYGAHTFKPSAVETRKYLARAVVRAFASDESENPKIHFTDLPDSDPFFHYANIAAKLGWMGHRKDHFDPSGAATPVMVHRALVYALGLKKVADGAADIHTTNGRGFRHPVGYGALLIGAVLGLRFNHDDEAQDVGPSDPLIRAEVAWSLSKASTIETSETWRKTAVEEYGSMELPKLSPYMRQVVQFATSYVGYPYVYAAEWYEKTPDGYCCGEQPRGGFDCSGLMWWLVKAPQNGYDNTAIRPYHGWALPERSSNDMAHAIPKRARVTFKHLRPGNLAFFDSDHDGTIDHVNLYIGHMWALDSGSNGVTIVRMEGWYQDTFAWGRRLVP